MHMHVHQDACMRTTIDLPDELRAKLLELAAKRGEKGFSVLVQEAVAAYLEQHSRGGERVKRALALRGALRGDDGDKLLEATEEARKGWR
jgi:predicted transcriptional regulator